MAVIDVAYETSFELSNDDGGKVDPMACIHMYIEEATMKMGPIQDACIPRLQV